ncbi:glutamine-dependent NAD(+) synthetase [Cadophora gregata]|uniref:glutamine-dependent NAD(+) synthetase n=1 Tax=Cadophora gregata TaxID=51156 RepID=UPI0026DB2503|nr:glutamine-dependent NAD(+) synthetase [Cadophora gregata]KAK0117771.1 glutamine-dependent NAD(+) synthetase [Cadophora gregata]KAK0122820.1 glutamine-dependent NAD(+) synthetase [Cadophora gregata f. sp. sojae]
MGHLITVATCSLNQWALDFEGNLARIIESIVQAKRAGASLRVGPELEIPGYGCLDHFLEDDTILHSWECLSQLMQRPECQDLLIDVGMPVKHKSVRYNCRVIIYNKQILLIRPKLSLANDGNYYEGRYFSPWRGPRITETHHLPRLISKINGQKTVTFGDALISTLDTVFGCETCEELFTPNSPHIGMGLDGCEIFTNSSGSHHELRKLHTRVDLIASATLKCGGLYLYANQQGCDGDRLYYDGCALIVLNGKVLAQGSQFSLDDVEVITATIDLEDVRAYRDQKSRAMQALSQPKYERMEVSFNLSREGDEIDLSLHPTTPRAVTYLLPEQEIAFGPACYLWDYLRRSNQAGFFLPLSGGIDSCATAVIVHSMTRLVLQSIRSGNRQVIADLRRIAGEELDSNWVPKTTQEIANRIFCTAYMGMEKMSSSETRSRAESLAAEIGAHHISFNLDPVYEAQVKLLAENTGTDPKFKTSGGTKVENLVLQNIQARLRMVNAYALAQLLPQSRGRRAGASGSLLVLGSANVDESLRGYLTKYDCSSADINPLGGISKTDLKSFIRWASRKENFGLSLLQGFLDAPPTAELEPLTEDYIQSDEADMGMTYNDLSVYGRLRKINKLGPYGMWEKLLHLWGNKLSPQQIYEKVRFFSWNYAINRHKMTTITPAYHMEAYGVDDNRFDQRPFLYPSFQWAYSKIERSIKQMGEAGTRVPATDGQEEQT